jgi:hypothetical protein
MHLESQKSKGSTREEKVFLKNQQRKKKRISLRILSFGNNDRSKRGNIK